VLLGVLFVNDWILKPTDLPHWLTGKLSDFVGLAVFPLVATAAFDLLLFVAARLGARTDFTLRRWKLVTAIALTGVVFATMKVVPEVALAIANALGFVLGHANVMPDPTDLVALPSLAFAWWWGGKTIARGSYGRCVWAMRARPATPFADAATCGADREAVTSLDAAMVSWMEGGSIEPVRDGLARLRA
jgi:hypothetical protein